jgi:hypothetical protein
MPRLNDHDSRVAGQTRQLELKGITGILDTMNHRQVDVIYLADLIHDYQGHGFVGGCGWELSRPTVLLIKTMLEGPMSLVTITSELEHDPAALAHFISDELDKLGHFVLRRESAGKGGRPDPAPPHTVRYG